MFCTATRINAPGLITVKAMFQDGSSVLVRWATKGLPDVHAGRFGHAKRATAQVRACLRMAQPCSPIAAADALVAYCNALSAPTPKPANGSAILPLATPSEPVSFPHNPAPTGQKAIIPMSKKNPAVNKEKQKAAKAAMTPEQRAFLEGKDDGAADLGLDPTPASATTKKTRKPKSDAADLGLEPKAPRVSPLIDKKLVATESGLKARENTVRGQVIKAVKGGVLYPTALKRLLEDESFKAPRSAKFADNREAYAKNRIARLVAIGFITAE